MEKELNMTTSQGTKRLFKSRTDRMIDGVCGGVAEYFALDPTLVRIVWVLLTFLGGSGILLYIAGMIIIPTSPITLSPPEQPPATIASTTNHKFWGILLVVVGVMWLLSNLGVWHRWWGLSWDLFLPTVLILAGVAFLFGGRNYVSNQKAMSSSEAGSTEPAGSAAKPPAQRSRLYRSRLERKFFGVCGGLGSHFGIDPTFVRILFVLSAFASFGLTIFAYFLMAIVVPDEPLTFTA
jgi:phage shock protein C